MFLTSILRARGRLLAAAVGLSVLSALPRPALATENSELEERTIARVLGPQPDREPAPEGQRIESVEIVRLPVFDDDDPVPDFVNVLHAQTREAVIRRELLFRPEQRYELERVQETIRNLQLLPQFGVVVVVALKGSAPHRVRLVVIVRDVWSLRLAYDFQGTSKGINYLLVNPTEVNLLGTRTQLGGVFSLQPDRYAVGASLYYPRIYGTRVDAQAQGGVYVNLDSGRAEGSYGAAVIRKDLISLADKWAYLAGATWTVEQTRVFQDRRLVLSEQGIPLDYSTRIVRAGGQLTRSYGTLQKLNLSAGVELSRRKFGATRGADTSARDFDAFVRDELPVSDTRLSPFVQIEDRTARYLATSDVETLALQESFWLGHLAALRVYPAFRDLASSRDLLGSVAWLGYSWRLDDGLLRVVGASSIEAADQAKHQASAQGALRVVTPRFGFARIVVDAAAVSTYQNYLNRKFALGGDTRPRGYISMAFRGASGAAGSLELRTRSLNILSARVGAVAFYDVGGTGEQLRSGDVTLHQSLGAGVRILFPQLNRQVFRLDWAAPLTAGRGRSSNAPLPGAVYFSFGQAFDMPNFKPAQMLSSDANLLQLTQ
jgi:hypothetical protein